LFCYDVLSYCGQRRRRAVTLAASTRERGMSYGITLARY